MHDADRVQSSGDVNYALHMTFMALDQGLLARKIIRIQILCKYLIYFQCLNPIFLLINYLVNTYITPVRKAEHLSNTHGDCLPWLEIATYIFTEPQYTAICTQVNVLFVL